MLAPHVEALPLRQPKAEAEDSLPKVAPIPMKEGALLEKDFRAEERAWARRMLLAPAQQKWKDKPWAEEATAVMEAALDQSEKEHRSLPCLGPLAGRFRELLKKAPDEPLLQVFGGRALFAEKADWREGQPLLEKALANGNLGSFLESMAVQARLQIAQRLNLKTDGLENRWFRALVRTLNDGTYDEASHTVLLRHHLMALELMDLGNSGQAEPLDRYRSQIETSKLPEWIRLTLLGNAEKELAWVKRGTGWANEVSQAGWRGFADHLKTARDLLGQAARLRPDRPEAASKMITVSLGESMDLTEIRAWFDRAVSAQFDYYPAYTALMWAYRPRWHGSHELMLAFGRACAATRRFDTYVPSLLRVAAMDVISEGVDPRAIFRHEELRQAMVDMSRGYLDHSPNDPPMTRLLVQSNAAMCAWLADDDKLALQALEAAGPRLHDHTRGQLNSLMMHEAMMRADVAADAGLYGGDVRAAANPAPNTPMKEIHTAFMKVDEKGLSEDALAFVRENEQLSRLQEAVNAGGWVDLHFYKHLASFYQSEEGEWTVEDGALVCHGTDLSRSRLALRVPLGEDVEVRGEVSFELNGSKKDDPGGFGPMMHWLPDPCSGVRAMIFPCDAGSTNTKAYGNSTQFSTPERHVPLQEWNSFSMRTADGKLGYDFNGRTMAARHDLAKLELEDASGYLGFSTYRLPIGSKVRVRNVSIRKITSADLAPATAASKSSAAAGTLASLPKADWLWLWKPGLIGLLILGAIFGPRLIRSEEE